MGRPNGPITAQLGSSMAITYMLSMLPMPLFELIIVLLK
jgi:hypothetical protein